jgi:cystathionine beta-lyase/cystathionine gamma-synthase
MKEPKFSRDTEILQRGAYLKGRRDTPETAPIHLTTAFNVEDLDDLMELYKVQGYGYQRTRNPNRKALAELVTYMEGGEDSLICGSGMAAISTTLMSMLEGGDHFISDKTLYGEDYELFDRVLAGYRIEVTYVDFSDLEAVRKAIRPNTRLFYTETISNPLITVVDVPAIVELARKHGIKVVIDNTFTTSLTMKPLAFGADVVINSLTKYANGHSDAMAGALTSSAAIIKKAHDLQVLLGTTADPFTSWLVQRGIRTMDLRVQRQMDNATKLAQALEAHPAVLKVNHPSLASHPGHEIAKRTMKNGFGGMMSIVLPDDRAKINAFLRKLEIAHYAMTLGGIRTTLSHPVSSSHYSIPEAERLRMGITFGLMRISVGIENSDDLIADFRQALEAFK